MGQYKYASKQEGDTVARVSGRDLDISTKYGIEVCSHIRGKPLAKAKHILQDAIDMKRPIPLRRFTNGPGHKPGAMGAGRYVVKTSSTILGLLKSAEANARNKGLNAKNLVVASILAQKASTPLRYGRQRRRSMKRTHVEVVLQEKAQKEKTKKND